MNTIIVGGGIIGLCSAYYLNREGYTVTVIDRGDITDGCSFGNMGYMSPSHFIPLASPGIIAEGLRHMLSSSSPFYIKPQLNIDFLRWGLKFWKNSNAKTVAKNASSLNNILQLSRHLIDDMRNEIGDRFLMETIGCLMMCKQEKTLEHEFQMADEAERFGLKVERLNKAAVQALEPSIELNVSGAVLFKDDCHFHPGRMMKALKTYLEDKGVHFKLHTTVTEFERNGNRISGVITNNGKVNCDAVVLAPGSYLPILSRILGIDLLLQPGKGYSYTYDHISNNIRYPAILVDGRCAITPWGNQLRIGGTMEFSGLNNKILFNRMKGIYDSAKDFYPGLQIDLPRKDKVWSGLRPVTPDGLPYIGRPEKFENMVIAAGHAMLGISQGPGTGKLVTQLIQHKTPEIDMGAFSLNRF